MSDNTTQTLRSGELWPELQNNILNTQYCRYDEIQNLVKNVQSKQTSEV